MESTRFPFLVLALALAALAASGVSAEPQYVGVDDCSRCHKKDLVGNQLAVWKDTKHAEAMKTLETEKAAEIAKEKGLSTPPNESDECVRCHATAHGLEESQIFRRPLDLSDGVQCESCHGPGSEYRKKTVHATSHEKALEAGLREPGKNEKICTACHNSESPTFEGFDYEKMKEEIAHPIPEENKGRVLELERAEREAQRQG